MKRVVYNTAPHTFYLPELDSKGTVTSFEIPSGHHIDGDESEVMADRARKLWNWLKAGDVDAMREYVCSMILDHRQLTMLIQIDDMELAVIKEKADFMLEEFGDVFGDSPPATRPACTHEPHQVQLIYSVVTECKKCGEKLG